MEPYALYLHEMLLEIVPKSGHQREAIMAYVRSLPKNPDQLGDFTDKDDTDRTLQVKIVGRYAVTWWADHPVREIKVTHIQLAERSKPV